MALDLTLLVESIALSPVVLAVDLNPRVNGPPVFASGETISQSTLRFINQKFSNSLALRVT